MPPPCLDWNRVNLLHIKNTHDFIPSKRNLFFYSVGFSSRGRCLLKRWTPSVPFFFFSRWVSARGDKPVTVSLQTEAQDDWPAAIASQHLCETLRRGRWGWGWGGGAADTDASNTWHTFTGTKALSRPICDRAAGAVSPLNQIRAGREMMTVNDEYEWILKPTTCKCVVCT